MNTKKIILVVIAMIVITGCKELPASYYYQKGIEYTYKKDYKWAVEYFSCAIELNQKKPEFTNPSQLYVYRGRSYMFLDKYGDALADFNTALSIDGKNADAYFGRGRTLSEIYEYDLAIKDYNTAIGIDDTEAGYYFWRGIAYQRWEKYDSAITDFNIAIKLDNSSALYYFIRGKTYEKLNVLDSAFVDFQKAATLGNEGAIEELKKYESD